MFNWLFTRPQHRREGHAVFTWALAQAKSHFPELFADEAPATDEALRLARFEAVALPMSVALWFLRPCKGAAQAAHDTMFASFDRSMREGGVGDIGVSHKIKKLAQAFYGRLAAYGPAYDGADLGLLTSAIARNQACAVNEAEKHAKWALALARQLAAQTPAAWLAQLETTTRTAA